MAFEHPQKQPKETGQQKDPQQENPPETKGRNGGVVPQLGQPIALQNDKLARIRLLRPGEGERVSLG